jgi:serine/threonine protein kinase
VDAIDDVRVVGTELAVSVMLSSLVRRGVCPNFVTTRGMFSCPFKPPSASWGSAENKRPKGDCYVKSKSKRRGQKEPTDKNRGRYQYIRMELCDEGDAEEFLKRQPNEVLPSDEARRILFQVSFALHASADRFSLKHYDVKLLNIFFQRNGSDQMGDVVMRYGLGGHTFALRTTSDRAIVAKLADYGTANVEADSTGQPVTIAQFTTLENTPPEFLMYGDQACQGHGHDCFGLGLCMLHLFTGHAPYEEILEDVVCPINLKKKLRRIWEDENISEFSVVRAVILADVYKDEDGNIIEGEPDETLYDTLYRFLVLFGIPEETPQQGSKIWRAVKEALEGNVNVQGNKGGRGRKKEPTDATRYCRDRKRYSLMHGNNKYIARARKSLEVRCSLVTSLLTPICWSNFVFLLFNRRRWTED